MSIRISILLLLLAVAGCASTPIGAGEAEAIPAEDMSFDGISATQKPGFMAEVTIVRDAGGTLFGMAKHLYVKVDGAQVADFERPGIKAAFFLPGGTHAIALGAMYSGTLRYTAGIQVTGQNGTNTVVHIGDAPAAGEPPRIFVESTTPI